MKVGGDQEALSEGNGGIHLPTCPDILGQECCLHEAHIGDVMERLQRLIQTSDHYTMVLVYMGTNDTADT